MDTIGNACFAKLLLKREDRLRPGMSVVVVTNDYHVLRTRQIFKRVFGADYYIDTGLPATPPPLFCGLQSFPRCL